MANKFWVGGTGTWDSTTTTHWSLTTGGAGGAAVPGAADIAIFDGSSGGGTVTVDSTISGLTFSGVTMGAFTGTLDFSANNPSITLSTFSITGAGTRTLNLGSGTFTITATIATVFDCTVATGLTLNAGTSTIVLSGSPVGSRNFTIASGITINTVTMNTPAGTLKSGAVNFNGGGTYTTLNTNPLTNITFGSATTVTNLNVAGSSGNLALLNVQTGSAQTITVTTASITWAVLGNITFATGVVNPTNSYSFGNLNLNGGTLTGPSSGGGSVFGS